MPPPVPAATSFNPLKVLIPSAVALLVVFAAIYALTRNSTTGEANTNTNQQVPALAADPNSKPVQPAQPATGKAEEGIPSGGTISPPANVNASPSASVQVSPAAVEDFTPTVNANANANANENTNSNSNRKAPALPEPTRSIAPETVPPPMPSATKAPAEKPSPTATPIGL
jgi:hypothetical protein